MNSNSASCFYTILGIHPGASEDIIRKAYIKRALEWHPDKNLNNPDTEHLFKILQKAYETLSNQESKQKYDNNHNDNDTKNVPHLLKLPASNCLSNMYKDRIDKWIEEYSFIKFVDNYEEELNSIVLSTLNTHEKEIGDPLEPCSVCYEFVYSKSQHIQMKSNDYLSYLAVHANDFNTKLSKLSSKGWNWQPIVQAPPIYRQLWGSLEWGTFKVIVEKMTSVYKIFVNTESTDRSFYELLHETHPYTEQIVADLASSKVLIVLPDVTSLKSLIDFDNSTYLASDQISSISRSKSGDQEYRQCGKICIVQNDTHPVLKFISYEVPQHLPWYTTNTKDSKCSNCHMKLHFFNKKDHCRMCSKLTCRKCILLQTCRHIGYVIPVAVCKLCSAKKITIIINTIHHHIQQQIKFEQYEYLAEYLSLLKAYGYEDNAFYESIARHLLLNRQFTLAIQCADHIHQSENDWLSLAEMMVRTDAYNEAATCFHIISRQFKRRAQYWISLGDTYRRQKLDSSTDLDSIKFAILVYQQAGLSRNGILRKATEESNANIRRILLLYVTYINKQTLHEWKTDGKFLLTTIYRRSIGICCLHLARLSIVEWTTILQELIDNLEYSSAAALLCTLSSKTLEGIMIDASPIVRFFSEEANKTKLPTLDRLKPVIESENINNILVIAALVHLRNEDRVWNTLKQQYVSETNHYDKKVLICHKIQVELNLTVCIDWIDQGVFENNPIAFDLKDSEQCDWLQIGYKYLTMANYDTALNCYLRAVKGSLVDRTSALEHILSLIPDLPDDIALWYTVVVYKNAQEISSVVCHSIQHMSKILDITQYSYDQFTISALHHLNNARHSTCTVLVTMNLCFLTSLPMSSKEFIGGLHFLETISASNSQGAALKQQYYDYIYVRDYEMVQKAMTVSIVELATRLKQVTNVSALKNFMNEYCDNLSINRFPSSTQTMLHLIDATIAKLESKYNEFAQKIQNILVHGSHNDVELAVAIVVKDPLLPEMGIQSFLSELCNLSNADLTKVTSLLGMSTATPPKVFQYRNHLKSNGLVKLIYQYEKGIIKNTSMDSFKSAMAYIDLCTAVSDRTCIASSWIIACLYLYKDLSKMSSCSKNQSRAYAYKNLINDLATNAFLLAREYLAPHMQMYIYKLALLLIVHTNRLFSQLIKSTTSSECNTRIELVFSPRQTVIITQVLKYIMDFVKLIPIMQVQPLLTYDVLFIEAVGFDFLRSYLKIMTEDETNKQLFFYQYYLLEGVWDGWIVDKNFELARQQSMISLLANKHWDVSDIERLLNDPLIPRTPEGWLYDTKTPLGLLGQKRYAKVDGIKFNFDTGEVKFLFVPARYPESMTLFDNGDIFDVFTKGITNAVVTLDQPNQDYISHPFQEMKYAPASLAGTKYLTTFLHADYQLKFMTTGMEVNSKWPFSMRPANNGFMKRLPKPLQDLLRPLEMRDKMFSRGRIHRFWIEAGDPVYEWVVNKKTKEIIYRISDMPMSIKQHLMKYDDEGRLVDDNQFDHDPDYSREAHFVKAFTDNYNEIGAYFPEFLRLKELAKLGILLNFIRHRYESLRVNVAEDLDVKQICEILCEARRDLEYPYDTDYNAKRLYEECLRKNNVSSYDVSHEEENEIKNEISSALKEDDSEIVESMVKTVCYFCHSTQKNRIQDLIDHWLRQSDETTPALQFCKKSASVELVSFIRSAIINQKRLLMSAIENLNVSLEPTQCSNLNNDNQTCCWVPAVFMNKDIGLSRIYGGVSLLPVVKSGNVNPDVRACSLYAATELDTNKRKTPWTYLSNLPTPYNGHTHEDDDKSVDGYSIASSEYRDETNQHSFDINGGNENTNGYDDNSRKDEANQNFNQTETQDQQSWITVFLQSNSTTNYFFTNDTEHNDSDENHENIYTFDNAVDCLDYLSSVDNGYVLVVVSDEYANDKQTLIKLQESLPISVIYRTVGGQDQRPLYTDKDLKDICPKLQDSFTNINPFSYPFTNDSNEIFNVFGSSNTQNSTRSLNKESVTFLWYQIMIDLLQSFVSTPEAKTDFFAEFRRLSVGDSNRLTEIDQLEQIYQTTNAVAHYVKHSCFYELINKALRTQNVSSIFHLRMGIVDLSRQLIDMRTQDTNKITVYRGQQMAKNEIEKLRGNINGLLSFNSFLSTSKSPQVAVMFANIENSEKNSDHVVSVLFKMETVGNLFSDIVGISKYSDEEECLFMIGTIFKIVSVERINLDRKNYYWNIQLINADETDLDELKRHKKQFQKRIAINKSPFQLRWGRFLYHIGEYNAAANHYEKWLKNLQNVDNNELLATIYNDLGLIYFQQKNYTKSNEYHSLAIIQAQTAPFPSGLGVFYENQGGMHMELKNYSKAIDMYQRALDIEQRRKPNNNLNIGRLYSNMGAVHYSLRQFSMALGCFQAAFKLQQRIPLSHATDLATTCNNLGNIYKNMNNHVEAEKFYSEAYKISIRSLPEGHRTVKLFENNWKVSLDRLDNTNTDVRSNIKIETFYPTGRRNSNVSISQIKIES